MSAIKFWSDGCASQFKSRYVFYMIAKYDNIEWNYFEANHDNGPVDGVDVFVKHVVYRVNCHK